jgi:hypothetical protein
MANEFHSGLARCVRTREIGRRLLPVAHDCGVRHLAMEALPHGGFVEAANRERRLPPFGGYLAQPEMQALVGDALDLGWTLIAYETTDARSPFRPDGSVDRSLVNAREEDQARNLAAALPTTPLLVWCGNGHLNKEPVGDWLPMGHLFRELSGIETFALDQTVTISDPHGLTVELCADLEPLGGTAGVLTEDLPEPFCACPVDALVFSLENELVEG